MDNNGFQCEWQKKCQITNVKRDESHMCQGVSMVAQHNTLPDGMGVGK